MADDTTMMTREHSAGVVVYRADLFGTREYLLLDYGRHWDFPKGHVEPGETDRSAAERELFEETGIRSAEFHERFGRAINYYFRARGKVISKSVTFFLARVDAADVQLSDEHQAFVWLPMPDAVKKLTFAGARDVLKHADAFLSAGG